MNPFCQHVLALAAALAVGLAGGLINGIMVSLIGILPFVATLATLTIFSGLAFGHFKLTMDHTIIEFAREFGLILFVFTIGIQVGPSFFASFKKQGIKLNLLAAAIVLLGVAVAIGIHFIAGLPLAVVVGLLSGAVTNTPGLGAAQQALKERMPDVTDAGELSGMGYAVAYPFGIIGIILTMILIRVILRLNVQKEGEAYEAATSPTVAQVTQLSRDGSAR